MNESILSAGSEATDAVFRAQRSLSQGWERIARYCFDTARASFEEGLSWNRKLLESGTVIEAAELQAATVTRTIDVALERSRVLSELTSAIARDLTQSLSDVVTETNTAATRYFEQAASSLSPSVEKSAPSPRAEKRAA